ncbi:MAG: hypothetical protein KAG14_03480, partial [Mycoplasmataceae bacterium]|nr:hypothetical protein [Mycoplasmataceae bacterium]
MNFKKIITLNLLLLLFIFVSCNKQSNINPLLKYIGSYIRAEQSIDIYENQKSLYIRLNQTKTYKINPNKRGIFKTDFVSGYFTADEENQYNILYIDNIA